MSTTRKTPTYSAPPCKNENKLLIFYPLFATRVAPRAAQFGPPAVARLIEIVHVFE